MLYMLFVLFLLSIDSFFVGAVFGMQQIKLPVRSAVVIFLVSCLMVILASVLGGGIFALLPDSLKKVLSAAIFIGVGGALLLDGLLSGRPSKCVNIHVKPLKLVITLMREPEDADLDRSKTIDGAEALYVGTALSADACAAAAAFGGDAVSPVMLSLIASSLTTVLLFLGCGFGVHIQKSRIFRVGALSGTLMILLGIFRLF